MKILPCAVPDYLHMYPGSERKWESDRQHLTQSVRPISHWALLEGVIDIVTYTIISGCSRSSIICYVHDDNVGIETAI